MPSNHLILCCPLLLPSIFPSIRVFSNESTHIRLPEYWHFSLSISSSNEHSRFVIAFLPRSECLLISWLQSPSALIWEPKKMKSVTVSIVSCSICHEVMGPDAMIFVFGMLSFKLTLSLSFTFIKRFFSSLSASRVVSSVYLRLFIFLPAILIPA